MGKSAEYRDVHVFVLPGGGYEYHAPHEAEPVAEWLEASGFSSSVLRYPLAPHAFPKARDFVADQVQGFRQDFDGRVGLLGFSAGGHLAGQVALSSVLSRGEKPDFVGLAYPVVELEADELLPIREALLGRGATRTDASLVSLPKLVGNGSPPFFAWHTIDDAVVPVGQTRHLAAALKAHEVVNEVHFYASGAHGLGLAEKEPEVGSWRSYFTSWIHRNYAPAVETLAT